MNRKELVRAVATAMRERDIKKSISLPKQVFHISDDDGNTKDFVLRKTDKRVLYTVEDIEAIIDSCIYVMIEALKRGEKIAFRGFGVLGLKYYKPTVHKHVATKEEVYIKGHYVPKFYIGDDLRRAAKIYEVSLGESMSDSDASAETASVGDL